MSRNVVVPVRTSLRCEYAEPLSTHESKSQHTYLQALTSAALVGGSSAATIAVGVIRNKAMALLLGPAGVGLIGLYGSITDLAQSVAGMGTQSSGVRQIAESTGSGDVLRIARTALVLQRVSVLLGLIGASALVLFAAPISSLTFGSTERTASVALLSFAVLCRIVSGGQSALIQGLRRIGDLARLNVLAALASVLVGVPLVYMLGERGVVPSLLAVAMVTVCTSWWYTRRLLIEPARLSLADVTHEARALLKLGFAFMASGLLTVGAAYVIRILVLRKMGYQAAGHYQAAWSLGGLYVGFVLQAMGADFYPRLTAVSKDNTQCARLVNEQAQISLLLAGPGIIATLAVAPLVLALFYSAEFLAAVHLLRWICLGMTLRVVAWPLGYIIVAKGAQAVFFWTEVAATVVHVGLAWLLVSRFGITGAGAAFFGLYVWHGLLIYAIVRRTSGFRWSPESLRIGRMMLPLTGAVFAGFYILPGAVASIVGLVIAALSGVYSLRTLLRLLPVESIPPIVWRCATRLRLVQPPAVPRPDQPDDTRVDFEIAIVER